MKLSIIVPVYNEERTVKEILERLMKVELNKEIIIVDDGSTDSTRQVLKEVVRNYEETQEIKVVTHLKNSGKGRAIRTALENIKGDVVGIQDADLEYEPSEYPNLLKPILEGKTRVVYGSRFLGKKRVTAFWHRGVNYFLTLITNCLFGSSLTDMATCYKVMHRDALSGINLKSERFEIEAELTARLLKKGISICEVPISYHGRSYHEGKKITWKDGIKSVWVLWKIRFCEL